VAAMGGDRDAAFAGGLELILDGVATRLPDAGR
jgi:hypothetical protein